MNSPAFGEWLKAQLIETTKIALVVVLHFLLYALILICYAAGTRIKHRLIDGTNPASSRPERKLSLDVRSGKNNPLGYSTNLNSNARLRRRGRNTR
jgi:hypothetical protein